MPSSSSAWRRRWPRPPSSRARRDARSARRRGRERRPAGVVAEGREDHRDGQKLALERVETEAQRLEREGAEENGVPRLAEDHLGDRVALPVPEEGNSAPAYDTGRVRQVELPLPARR